MEVYLRTYVLRSIYLTNENLLPANAFNPYRNVESNNYRRKCTASFIFYENSLVFGAKEGNCGGYGIIIGIDE